MADGATNLPDERQARADLNGGAFVLGVLLNRWLLVSLDWPFACIEIRAASSNYGAPSGYVMRFDLSGYPQQAPTARLWDVTTNAPLPVDRWPAGTTRVPKVFRGDWHGGACLYLPCDRISAQGHPDWPNLYTSEIWKPGCTISHYLNQVSELLTTSDYTGWRHA